MFIIIALILTILTRGWFIVFFVAIGVVLYVYKLSKRMVNASKAETIAETFYRGESARIDKLKQLQKDLYSFLYNNTEHITDVYVSPAVKERLLSMLEFGGCEFSVRVNGIEKRVLISPDKELYQFVIDEPDEPSVDVVRQWLDSNIEKLLERNKAAYGSGQDVFVVEEDDFIGISKSELVCGIKREGFEAEPVDQGIQVMVDELLVVDIPF